MTPRDFVNYLNGAVDFGGLKAIDEKNYAKLTEKLASVTVDSSKEGMFCVWLQGVMDMLDERKMNGVQFGRVVNKLQSTMNNFDDYTEHKNHDINTHGQVLC